MKFYKFLNEKEFYKENLDKILFILKRDCQPFLNDIKGSLRFLYHGSKNLDKNMEIKLIKSKKNRLPKDTPLDLHNLLDNLFKKKFGIKLRSNSLFCSSSDFFVSSYGHPSLIFPVGKYEVYWSKKIIDLYSITKDYIWYESDEEHKKIWNFNFWWLYENMKKEKSNNYWKENFYSAFESRTNKKFKSFEDKTWLDLYNKTIKDKDKVLNDFISLYIKGNIKDALWTSNEIMLVCDEFYFVKNYYENEIRDSLL